MMPDLSTKYNKIERQVTHCKLNNRYRAHVT